MNDPAQPALLTVRDVSKAYGDRTILDRVCFELQPGERVAVMGPSGSGKSTLLNCLAGIDRADSGTILLDGEALENLGPDALSSLRRTRVSTVFQFFHLLPTLTAAENIELPLQLLGVPETERRTRVAGMVEAVQLTHRMDAFPDSLSGGEMQRVAIARALIHQPVLVLADEPTGNLDSQTSGVILQLLAELTRRFQMALLMVTHSAESTGICDRVLQMTDGKLTGAASPQ